MKSNQKGNKFTVDFGDIELSSEAAELIERNIQQAALQTMANFDLAKDITFRFPRDWAGMIWSGPDIDILGDLRGPRFP